MTIIKKFEPEEQKSGNAGSKKYIGLIAIVLFALTLIEIWASNTVVVYGGKFEKLSGAANQLAMENQILENEIAKRTSLSNIASKSAELGFIPPQSIQYIR